MKHAGIFEMVGITWYLSHSNWIVVWPTGYPSHKRTVVWKRL